MAETELGDEALVFDNAPPGGEKDEVQVTVNYDLAMKYLGGFGPWQRRIFLLLCLPVGVGGFQVFAIVFLAVEPDFHCRVPQASFSGLNATPAELLNATIPWELKDGEWRRSQCKRYSYNFPNATHNVTYRDFVEAHPVANRTQIKCDRGYEHDTSEYKSTVVTDWDLVCDSSWKVSMAKSVWFAGFMVGAVFGGHVADSCVSGIVCAFSPNYAAFIAFRFFIATSTMVTFLAAFVMIQELVSADKRSFTGMVFWIFAALAQAILAAIAYFIRTWKWLQVVITVPTLLFISFWWLIPESPRWLISRSRHKEAAAILRKGATVAKVTLPDEVFHDNIPLTQDKDQKKTKEKVYTFIDLFRTPNLRKWTLNIFFLWIVNTLVYYGISLNLSALSGNVYLNFAISGLIEIPANLLPIFLLNKFGRRWPLCALLLAGGVACIVAFFIPKHLGWMTTTLAMIGKFCITASFGVTYVFSAEIFPTVVRQIGMGMSSMSARVGGIAAPFVNLLGRHWAPMPYVIFGGTSIAAGLLTLLLPETAGRKLPATIEEGENFGKGEGIVNEE
ncbi:PREDICTED: organic cation transporter protein-like [Branchiostoma belcheri]|uniref:Organic cation transporter protein-like n=1 Tax=Branchiostoma belcheri TaxID=7741 RepID=A0A6P4YDQ3_BRABE|nr:PREDICTED: organic cation transporter protein-like [Branchiostoma belcheri]